MALDIGLATKSADGLANEIKTMLASMHGALSSWRALVNTSSTITSGLAEQVYQNCAAVRVYVEANKNAPGLAAAFTRQNVNLDPEYDPGAEWDVTRGHIETLCLWIQTNWPEKTVSGKPAYVAWNVSTGVHQEFSFPITGGTKTTFLGLIDAVLNSLV
jgi:hypothetical protein